MEIEAENWERYAKMQGRLRDTAAGKMENYLNREKTADVAGNFGSAADAPQWVAYRMEKRNGSWTKVPMNPVTGRNAMTNKPETWGTLAQAQEAMTKFGADGIGFVLADGYFGIDLDGVIDPLTGNISEYALDIVNRMGSYAELSPSGTGIHIIARGDPRFDINKNGNIEMYYPTLREDGSIARGRYFTVTGEAFGQARPIAERTEAAQSVWDQYVRGRPELPQDVIQIAPGIIDEAYLLSTQYGEASAALAAAMYDEIAAAQGMNLPPAEPAETADYDATAQAIQGTLNNLQNSLPATVGRLVKQAGEDTMLKNAVRDGAEWAWIPWGTETCAFCITLASQGWQPASPSALKGGHASHIHANCFCEYAVRFDKKSGVKSYHPEEYLEQYRDAEGRSSKDKINAMRRELYDENRQEINAQKRAAYARRREAARKAGE